MFTLHTWHTSKEPKLFYNKKEIIIHMWNLKKIIQMNLFMK